MPVVAVVTSGGGPRCLLFMRFLRRLAFWRKKPPVGGISLLALYLSEYNQKTSR